MRRKKKAGKKGKKPPKLTTDEAITRLFPKSLIDAARQRAGLDK